MRDAPVAARCAQKFACQPGRRSGRIPALPYPPLEQNRSLSLSLSLGVYRAGKGKGNFELAAAGVPNEFPRVDSSAKAEQMAAVRRPQSFYNCWTYDPGPARRDVRWTMSSKPAWPGK